MTAPTLRLVLTIPNDPKGHGDYLVEVELPRLEAGIIAAAIVPLSTALIEGLRTEEVV